MNINLELNTNQQLNEVCHFPNSTLVEKYWYDESGVRLKKQSAAGEVIYYINDLYEVENGTSTSYYFRDDERVAKKTNDSMEWYLSDHLGSTSLMIDKNGTEVERSEYFPYGAIESGGSEKYGFTGQENDVDTGLMYYGARYYSPEVRLFTQPDTMLPDVYNPQYLNRYAYCLDNPLKYNDPSGHVVDYVFDAISLGLSINDYRNDPSAINAAFVVWDVVALALPIVPGSLTLKVVGIKGGKYYDNIMKAVDDMDFATKEVYNFHVGFGELAAGESAKIIAEQIFTSNINDDNINENKEVSSYIENTFNTKSFNVDTRRCSKATVKMYGRSIKTIKDNDGYMLIGINKKSKKSLWKDKEGNVIIKAHKSSSRRRTDNKRRAKIIG